MPDPQEVSDAEWQELRSLPITFTADPQEAATPSDPHSAEALDLDAIQKRADAATGGPWEWTGTDFESGEERLEATSVRRIIHGYDLAKSVLDASGMHTDGFLYLERTDAEFIAHARTDVPALVAALRSRDAEVAELKAKIAELQTSIGKATAIIDRDVAVLHNLDPWEVKHALGVLGSASSPVEGGGLEGDNWIAEHSRRIDAEIRGGDHV